MPMMTVAWMIDVDEPTPEEAVERAWELMHNEDTLATVFSVYCRGKRIDIDRKGKVGQE